MRIVVSGTHASGKSTLISDFALRHPEFAVLPDPFELVDEAGDGLGASLFAEQLRIAADRLTSEGHGTHLIAERGPLDFLAYLLALAELTATPLDRGFLERATARTAEALATIDLLIVLPLTVDDPIHVGADEYLDLRHAMNDVLLELVDDPDLIGAQLPVVEITGTPGARLAALEALVGPTTRAIHSDQGPQSAPFPDRGWGHREGSADLVGDLRS
ncbi:MAG: hypothetical protein AAGC63_08400 [Propionicimonas sp.]